VIYKGCATSIGTQQESRFRMSEAIVQEKLFSSDIADISNCEPFSCELAF
jgi:hypothetical protein